ncbi:MAG: helix-turn-helix domain-containing protein [Clostridiales bacterium]|nr:helix-turn-helix domain-containing protein [Clostridiales bacterium]
MDKHDINQSIGARLRELRGQKQLTLETLSGRTGVSVSMLSAIERGRKSPTLTILNKIKSGLRISLSELLDESHNNDRRVTAQQEMRVIRRKKGCELWMLVNCENCTRFEVMRQEIAPRSRWESEPHLGGNLWEHCLIVRGELTMIVDGSTYCVRQGELFSFMAGVGHTYINDADSPLTMIVINAYV